MPCLNKNHWLFMWRVSKLRSWTCPLMALCCLKRRQTQRWITLRTAELRPGPWPFPWPLANPSPLSAPFVAMEGTSNRIFTHPASRTIFLWLRTRFPQTTWDSQPEVEPVGCGCYSCYFLVPNRKSGGLHPILDLHLLNLYLKK